MLFVNRWSKPSKNLAKQNLEPVGLSCDRLSNPNNGPDGDYLRSGIEMDAFGEAVAYHIRAGHPSDVATSMRSLPRRRSKLSTLPSTATLS